MFRKRAVVNPNTVHAAHVSQPKASPKRKFFATYGLSAIPIALLLLVLILGLAADVFYWYFQKVRAQAAADAAAWSVSVAVLAGETLAQLKSEVIGVASANGFVDGQQGVHVTLNNPPVSGSRAGQSDAYEVVISTPEELFLSKFFPSEAPSLVAHSVIVPGTHSRAQPASRGN